MKIALTLNNEVLTDEAKDDNDSLMWANIWIKFKEIKRRGGSWSEHDIVLKVLGENVALSSVSEMNLEPENEYEKQLLFGN